VIWQDVVFAAGSLVFVAALVPMVRAKNPPPLSSSLSTGTVLVAFVACYATLGSFWLATATTALTAGLWLELARQRLSVVLQARRRRKG